MSKYIKVDDLQKYCDNQKDHSITPNDFQRMTQYDFGWQTDTPTEEGWYLVWMGKINGNINEHPSVMLFENGDWASRLVANTYVAWQKITPYEEKEK